MLNYNIHDKHIRKDSWVKDMRKTFNPETLADLIKKRIEFPNVTGPYINKTDETPTDIISALIADDDENRKKLTPAVGFLLYKMLHGKMGESHEILRGVFAIISDCKLMECEQLVYDWLRAKHNHDPIDTRWKHTYRDGMMAYAHIQSKKNKETEAWWLNIWRESSSVWWPAAFMGLRIQNPSAAIAELPLMISRNTDKAAYLLLGAWNDPDARGLLEQSIHRGLNANTGWAGLALNMLLEKLTDEGKNQIMMSLKRLGMPN